MSTDKCRARFDNTTNFQGVPELSVTADYLNGEMRSRTIANPLPGSVMIPVPPDPAAIVAASRSYIGTPWRNMGRNTAGLDCIGLILAVGRDAGAFTYDPGAYGRETSLRETKRHFAKFCDTVPAAERAPGDFAIFAAPGWAKPHAGILAHDSRGRETMIHALPMNRKVTEDRMGADWLDRLVAVYRVRG